MLWDWAENWKMNNCGKSNGTEKQVCDALLLGALNSSELESLLEELAELIEAEDGILTP